MELKSGGEAVVRALEWMGLPPTHSAGVHRVYRLDAPSSAYYLVQAGDACEMTRRTGKSSVRAWAGQRWFLSHWQPVALGFDRQLR